MRPAARRPTRWACPAPNFRPAAADFGLAIVLVPVALITWGVRMVRTHHLGFFGLRLSLLLALLDDERGLRRAGRCRRRRHPRRSGRPDGARLVGRFRELVLTQSTAASR